MLLHCLRLSSPQHNLCLAVSPTGTDRCAAGATNICGPGTCVNLPDGYKCICNPGYQLHPSQAYCTGMHWDTMGSHGAGDRVKSPGSRKSKQCCVANELKSAFPVEKTNLNLGETSLREHHLMSLQNSRRVGSHPRAP